ncbi:hypothetical protein BJY01DRAFT_259108 [Aspergillus pseudoustus]|uniref:ADP-ribose 1''-phosphate phosphatase n=1 Tax=Aspergillus pseudoustus TaxID=1810923 RepID=A0ABR4KQ43_9EURO
MPQKRHRIDFSMIRRRKSLSSTSSSDLSPTVPVLESPISFQALTSQSISEATLKQNKLNRTPVKPSMFFEEKEEDEDGTVPNLTSGDPKDGRSARAAHKSGADERLLSRTKSHFFEDSFSTRSPWITPSARMCQESLVVIEIKMNTRRSESLMVVTIQQGSCLQFGALTLPAYTMKLFALPYLIAPITNLRSTILIQAALHEIIHIAPARGVIIYIPVAEENMATNSTTMMGEIARLERETHDREPGIFKSLSRSLSRRKKSSSGQSVPLSVATTSSWALGSDQPNTRQERPLGSEETNVSLEGSNGRFGRSSKTLRLFMATSSKVTEIQGDLFQAPENAALIHACNCKGSWGSGIAASFKSKYPAAFKVYKAFCDNYLKNPHYLTMSRPSAGETEVRLPEGRTLIIPPQTKDYERPQGKKHWIICLFTSNGYGKNVRRVEVILNNTESALAHMKAQLPDHQEINGLYACKFNAGLFNVPWARTKTTLEAADVQVTVVVPLAT